MVLLLLLLVLLLVLHATSSCCSCSCSSLGVLALKGFGRRLVDARVFGRARLGRLAARGAVGAVAPAQWRGRRCGCGCGLGLHDL